MTALPKVYCGLLVALGCFCLSQAFPRPGQVNWISQPLNHLNRSAGTYNQRYWVSDKFYKPGGPVYLYIGAEGEASHINFEYSYCKLWARNVAALCMVLEHRYYGKSSPVDISQQSYSTQSGIAYRTGTFKYLSSDQALGDVGTFIEYAKRTYGLQNNKWVAFGGSYGGTLAAWARQRFPQLIFAAVASSAPLEAGIDYSYFYRDMSGHKRISGDDGASWWYQTCTEFGWYNQRSTAWNVNEAARHVYYFCSKYNEGINYSTLSKAISATNQKHGGKKYFMDRVIFVHGSEDHWRLAGITKSPDQARMPVLVIPEARHCEDMLDPPSPRAGHLTPGFDYPANTNFQKVAFNIRSAQLEVLRLLSRWLRA